jgi:hypothetical protein
MKIIGIYWVNRKKYTNALCNQTAENLSIKLRGSFLKLSFERLNTRSLPSTKHSFHPLFPTLLTLALKMATAICTESLEQLHLNRDKWGYRPILHAT